MLPIEPAGHFVKSGGFDALALTLFTQLQRYAMHRTWAGSWPSDQRCEPSQVLSEGGKDKFILGASWATQSKSTEPQDTLQVFEPHLDLLAFTSRLLKALGASERPSDVPRVLMDITRDLA
jgi:hypothetical protein